MTHVHAAADGERLPWLHDDLPAARSGAMHLLGWGSAAVALVAGLSFWMGMNSPMPSLPDLLGESAPEATVKLPTPVPVEPIVRQPVKEAVPQVAPVLEPAPVVAPRIPEVRSARETAAAKPAVRKRPKIRRAAVVNTKLRDVVKKQAAPTKAKAPAAWTSWESAGASGRMVRIGTYRTRSDAKRAWARLVKLYPGMKRLQAVTTDIPSLRNGRTYYRLQFGTTSQAHSEVLCQRMKLVGQSCVVVDLAGARARNQDVGQPIGL